MSADPRDPATLNHVPGRLIAAPIFKRPPSMTIASDCASSPKLPRFVRRGCSLAVVWDERPLISERTVDAAIAAGGEGHRAARRLSGAGSCSGMAAWLRWRRGPTAIGTPHASGIERLGAPTSRSGNGWVVLPMAAGGEGAEDGAMARLVVLWNRPYHLSAEEAAGWARTEASRLLALEVVERAELTRLQSASERHARCWDWMLELHLAPDADRDGVVDLPPCGEWLADLRRLGLRPTVLLVDGGIALRSRQG